MTWCYASDADADVVYNAVTPCYCSMFDALGSVVIFEACCQWALSIECKSLRHYHIIYCTEVHLILQSEKCLLGLFVLP